jgi:hypothetical protein
VSAFPTDKTRFLYSLHLLFLPEQMLRSKEKAETQGSVLVVNLHYAWSNSRILLRMIANQYCAMQQLSIRLEI